MNTYLRAYNTAHRIVDRYAALGGCDQLYRRLTSYLREKASAIRGRAEAETQGESLAGFYDQQQRLWVAAAKKNSHMLSYFDRHWISRLGDLRQLRDAHAVEAFTWEPLGGIPDNGGINIHETALLHVKVWDQLVLQPLKERLEAHAKTGMNGTDIGTDRYNVDDMVLEIRGPKQD